MLNWSLANFYRPPTDYINFLNNHTSTVFTNYIPPTFTDHASDHTLATSQPHTNHMPTRYKAHTNYIPTLGGYSPIFAIRDVPLGMVFRDPCLEQGIQFTHLCLEQGIYSLDFQPSLCPSPSPCVSDHGVVQSTLLTFEVQSWTGSQIKTNILEQGIIFSWLLS